MSRLSSWSFARSTIRAYRASFVGTFVVAALAAALLSGVGVLMESGIRGGVAPDRYRDVDVVVTAPQPSSLLSGPSTSARGAPLDRDTLAAVEAVPGVAEAAAEVTVPLAETDGTTLDGHDWDLTSLTHDPLVAGEPPLRSGEVVLDAGSGHHVGDEVTLSYGGAPAAYTVVGLVDQHPASHRSAAAYLSAADLDRLWPQGTDRARVIGVVTGDGESASDVAQRIDDRVPGVDALAGVGRGGAEFSDAATASGNLMTLSGSFFGTASVIVVFILASTLSLAVRQRRRQFALLRAVGATPRQLRAGIAREVLLVSGVAAVVGAVPGAFLALLLRPSLTASGLVPADFDLVVSPIPVLTAAVTVVVVSLLASLLAARKATRIAPADAIREAVVESPTIGRVRAIAAIVTGAAGLAAAFSPVFVPGTIGGATAGMSAILLIGAVALAGPPLVVWLLDRATPVLGRSRSATVQLAAANSRGFSRRLTAAIVPLAMALSFGAVQTTVNATLAQASTDQLRDATTADLVVTGPAGIQPRLVDDVAATPGVVDAAPVSSDAAQINTDADEEPPFDSLGWESTSLRAVPPGISTDVLDLDVADGSLADLAAADSVAISRDLATESMLGVGDQLEVRFSDGRQVATRVVAVYERGLGFGDLTVGRDTLLAHTHDDLADTLLVDAEPGETGSVSAAVAGLGLDVVAKDQYVADGVEEASQAQDLSAIMLLVLLAFIALAALNSLATATAERRAEFALVHRIGATRRQLVRTTAVEALITATAALAIGLVALVPAAFGIAYGLTGTLLPRLDWLVLAGLATTVVVTAFAGTTLVSAVVNRPSRPSPLPSSAS